MSREKKIPNGLATLSSDYIQGEFDIQQFRDAYHKATGVKIANVTAYLTIQAMMKAGLVVRREVWSGRSMRHIYCEART